MATDQTALVAVFYYKYGLASRKISHYSVLTVLQVIPVRNDMYKYAHDKRACVITDKSFLFRIVQLSVIKVDAGSLVKVPPLEFINSSVSAGSRRADIFLWTRSEPSDNLPLC